MDSPDLRTKVRLTLELDYVTRDSMEELKRKSRAASLTEVVRRALALYDLHLDHIAKNGAVILRSADGTEERIRIL